ncbi:MAG TPA: magnesium/cobalt transporter CorA [Geobacteraceae bacterium]|nr:magnesium/cobalt transporter CorA [Geobacteraceae bacterium]
MKKLLKKRSRKAGLSPGSLVHIGDERQSAPRTEVITFNRDRVDILHPDLEKECMLPPSEGAVTWVNVEGIGRLELLRKLGDCYGIHPLVLEDIANTDQRPKAEEYDKYLFVVLKMLTPVEGGVSSEQVSLVLGEGWLLTFQEGLDGDPFNPVRQRLNNVQGRARSQGADYLAYSLMDVIVDNYFLVLEQIAESIEMMEEELMLDPAPRTLAEIYRLKRELLFIHKAIWPLREVINSMVRRDSPMVKEATLVYLRDLYDHTIQVIETVETLRDMLSGMLDIYLSSVSNRMNAVMKVLTIIATIFMPLTFIVGVYGMNFKHMPELEWQWGYPAVWFLMVGITVGMIVFFRRKRWF